MWRFVLRENIRQLQARLEEEVDESERASLSEQLRAAERELAELEEASAHAQAAHDRTFAEALTILLRDMVRRCHADLGNIQLYEAESRRLHIAAQLNFRKAFLEHFAEVEAGDGSVCGTALETREPVWVEDVEAEPSFAPHLAVTRESEVRAVVSLPLMWDGGQLLGMVSLHFHQPRTWTEEERADYERSAAWLAAQIVALRPTAH